MRKKILFLFSFLFLTLLMMVLLQACANMAAPTGGAYDVDPPKVRQATPNFNSLDATPSKIEIEFDENIKIKSPAEK